MLSAALYAAALPCSDLERARRFYADKLGLMPADEHPGRLSTMAAAAPGSCSSTARAWRSALTIRCASASLTSMEKYAS